MLDQIEKLRLEGTEAIAAATTSAELEELRVKYLGRKAELTQILRGISQLEPAERGPVGGAANKARRELEALIEGSAERLDAAELDRKLVADRIDVTMPGAPVRPLGHQHLIARTTRLIEDVMVGLGYFVAEGPEIEHDYYNFTALNHPPGHPARMLQDTFYVQSHPDVLLRTHSPMFSQMEGLAIAEGLTLADLKGTLLALCRALFGETREVRLRPHYFPFTEPSVEVDVSCFQCDGTGVLPSGERCNLCKGQGWIEILGAGMVDPNVLGFVKEMGYDPEKVQGFAYGLGIERVAMLRHGIPDLRRFFDNDVRMLEQFS